MARDDDGSKETPERKLGDSPAAFGRFTNQQGSGYATSLLMKGLPAALMVIAVIGVFIYGLSEYAGGTDGGPTNTAIAASSPTTTTTVNGDGASTITIASTTTTTSTTSTTEPSKKR